MNKFKVLPFVLSLSASLLLVACGDDMSSSEKGEKKILYWVAPMDPNFRRDEPGKSPMGMDLVPFYAEDSSTSAKKEKEILYWVAPMDPNFRRDEPGKSPMGMDLVPFYSEEGGDDSGAVTVSPSMVQNLGVRTAQAEVGKLWKRVDTVGYVDFDENKISHVHLRTEGWIENLVVKSEGARVKKGDLLFELYSPTLVNAQDEYIQALASQSKRLISASKERLISLGVNGTQITSLEKTRRAKQRVKIFAQQDGIVSHLNAREGMFIKPRMKVMTLADLSSIWIQVEVFERQAEWVKQGKPAEINVSYLPGRTWEGTVEYVYPSLNPMTRTLRARLRFDNQDESLKPNMFTNVTIFGGATQDVISIPLEALIRTGESERVIVALGEGRFSPREVVSGIESGDRIEILKGLEGNEYVVTSSQFLLDSEASIKASMNRMTETKTEMATAMQKDEMSASKMVTGKGVLRELMPDENKLNMSHEPIEELGWPDMTMDFKVSKDVVLRGLEPGMAIEFDLVEDKGSYLIMGIRPQDTK